MRATAKVIGLALLAGCNPDPAVLPDPDKVAVGTWGGENAALIVSDSVAHVHVGCTNGYFRAPLRFANGERFEAAGSYVLRAYPVAVGPTVPAVISGRVSGTRLTFTVVVNDTVEKKNVTLGPSEVFHGRAPRMGPCPICRTQKFSRGMPSSSR